MGVVAALPPPPRPAPQICPMNLENPVSSPPLPSPSVPRRARCGQSRASRCLLCCRSQWLAAVSTRKSQQHPQVARRKSPPISTSLRAWSTWIKHSEGGSAAWLDYFTVERCQEAARERRPRAGTASQRLYACLYCAPRLRWKAVQRAFKADKAERDMDHHCRKSARGE